VATTTARAVTGPSAVPTEPAVTGQGARELRGQLLHAARRDGGPSAREHPHHQVGEAARGGHVLLEQHPGEEGHEHGLDQLLGDPGGAPGVGRAHVVAVQQPLRGQGGGERCVRTERGLASHTADRQPDHGGQAGGALQRVGHHHPAAVDADRDRGVERAEVEGAEVDDPAHLRVAGVEHLEAPVEGEAVDPVRAHPAADGVPGLQHPDLQTAPGQRAGAGQPGQAGPDHHDVGHGRSRWACRNSGGR
jgi:hypothetical protein